MSKTPYGFTWGPLEVTRIATWAGRRDAYYRALGVNTGHHKVEVIVSPTGRSVRIFRDGKEIK